MSVACCALAGDISVSVINGTPTSGYPSVGALAFGPDLVSDGFCSGTLVEPDKVLTAAHCTMGDSPDSIWFLLGGVPYPVAKIYIHPQYNSITLEHDVSLLILETPVSGVTPSPLYRQAPAVGQYLTLVGYGLGGTPADGIDGGDYAFGTKRAGTVRIDEITSNWIIWGYNSVFESNTAPGDSGGPAFLTVGGVPTVAGITSWGIKADASLGDVSYDTRVDAHTGYIDSPSENPSPLLVYRTTESGYMLGTGGVSRYYDRGYLLVDSATGNTRLVALRQASGADPVVVASAWSGDHAELGDYMCYASNGGIKEVVMAYGPAEWRGAWGPTSATAAYYPRLAGSTGERLSFSADGYRHGRLILRFDRYQTARIDPAETLANLAATCDASFDGSLARTEELPAAEPPAPPTSSDDTIYVYRLAGTDRYEANEAVTWYRARGFFVHQPSTQRAVMLVVFPQSGFTLGYTMDLASYFDSHTIQSYPLASATFHIFHGQTDFYQWGSSYGGIERATITGVGAPDGGMPRVLGGTWDALSVLGGSGIIDVTRLHLRLDAARTAAADGSTVDAVLTELKQALGSAYGAIFL